MFQDLLPLAIWTLELAWLLVFLAGAWKTFARAGLPGWVALVPVYNAYAVARLGDRSRAILWVLLLLVPGVNLIALGKLSVLLAERLGRGVGFGLGLAFLPLVFYPWAGLARDPREGPREVQP